MDRIRTLAHAELSGAGEILDVGCGNGWLLAELHELGVAGERLRGVDLLAHRVAAASERVPSASISTADATALPIADASFDLVLMITLLSSMASRAAVAQALGEGQRVVRPGGLLLAYEPRIPNPSNPRARLISRRDFESGLGEEAMFSSLTLLPQLARRLGGWNETLYPALASIRVLRSHRLVAWRAPDLGAKSR